MKFKKYKPKKPPKMNYSFINKGTSREELDLHNTIKLLLPGTPTFRGNRTILHGREIDIWIPSWRIGIEYNGLWFHSASSKSREYHLWKTVEAERSGVRLIHIWSDLWETRRMQSVDYLSKIFRKFDLIKDDVYVEEISMETGNTFLNKTHILGPDFQANKFIGLYYKTSLVTVFSFKVEENTWTLLRRGELRTLRIENDIQKVLDFIYSKYGKNIRIKAEIDRSLFNGKDLVENGFTVVRCSGPQSVWTKDFKSRKLQESKTDEQWEELGYQRFYDCGRLYLELKK